MLLDLLNWISSVFNSLMSNGKWTRIRFWMWISKIIGHRKGSKKQKTRYPQYLTSWKTSKISWYSSLISKNVKAMMLSICQDKLSWPSFTFEAKMTETSQAKDNLSKSWPQILIKRLIFLGDRKRKNWTLDYLG